jgi:hypothetical protein
MTMYGNFGFEITYVMILDFEIQGQFLYIKQKAFQV